ncbi:MAG: PhnD/SsuA/transferrin family substrate-binding protein [Hyphomicrobiaceae bacterium]
MPDLKLQLACFHYDRVQPLLDGRVKPAGIDLDIVISRPHETFTRMLNDQAFEAAELSLASYVTLIARGECPFVAMPVALSKIFRHSCIYIRTGAGIRHASDLKGKRVGVTQYGATATVFMKGLLADEYGVHARDIHWFVGGLTAPTQPPLVPLALPPDIRLEFVGGDDTLEAMLERGELDALLSIYLPPSFLAGKAHIARLFPDFKAAETEHFRKTGIFPIMHAVVVRKDVVAAHPWVPANLYAAFTAAKDMAISGLYDTDALHLSLPFLLDHVEESRRVFGDDFWSYGHAPNRPALAALGRWVHEQGLAPRVVSSEEIFDPAFDRPERHGAAPTIRQGPVTRV